MHDFCDDIMSSNRCRHTSMIIIPDHFPTRNIHLKKQYGLEEFRNIGLHGLYLRMPDYGTKGDEELDIQMNRHSNFYVYICNICDRIMPDFLTSTELAFRSLRNNFVRWFPNPDDDHMSSTSSRS